MRLRIVEWSSRQGAKLAKEEAAWAARDCPAVIACAESAATADLAVFADGIERSAMQGHAAVLRLLLAAAAKPVEVMPIGSWVGATSGIQEILAEFGVRERG